MMTALLLAVVRFIETVVSYSLGAVVLALLILCACALCRWLATHSNAGSSLGRAVGALRRGSGSLALAAVLAGGLLCILAGVALWTR